MLEPLGLVSILVYTRAFTQSEGEPANCKDDMKLPKIALVLRRIVGKTQQTEKKRHEANGETLPFQSIVQFYL